MPRLSHIQNTLNGGEFSRSMHGRTDVGKYNAAAKQLVNFTVRPQGGIQRRSGSKFVVGVDDNAKSSRIAPFTFSTTQAYLIEFADGKCRFFRNEVPIYVDAQTFTDSEVNVTTDEIEVLTDHYFIHQQGPFRLANSGGTLPGGLDNSTDYYVKLPQETSFANADYTDVNTTDLFNIPTHGYDDEQGPFMLRTTGSLDDGLDTNTPYFISYRDNAGSTLVDTTNDFTLSTTAGGNAIALTGLGTDGTHTLYPTDAYKRGKFQVALTAGGAAVAITSAAGGGTHTIDEATDDSLPVELAVPYAIADVHGLQTAQSADVLFVAGAGYVTGKIGRTGHATWTFDYIDPQDGPYLDTNTTDDTMQPSASSGEDAAGARITITASTATFAATDVGRLIRINGVLTVGWAEIREVVSSTVVRVNIKSDFEDATANTAWRLGAWGSAATLGYPSAISFFEQRLALAANAGGPATFYSSRTVDFENFAPSATDGVIIDSHALSYTLNGALVDAVQWMASSRSLIMGTTDGLWPMQATSFLDPITPTNVQAKPSSHGTGTAAVVPQVVEDVILYVSPTGRKVKGVRYVFDSDSYTSTEFSIAADELFEKGVKQIAYQQEPYSVVWFLMNDGKLRGLTYFREQEVVAWHQHAIAGTDAEVESIAVIPDPGGTHDQLWMTVKRTVDGNTVRYIEFLEDRFLRDSDEADLGLSEAYYCDAGVRDTSASTTISGLDHLEDEEVCITVDGSPVANQTVVTGAITLDAAGTVVMVGLPFTSTLETLDLNIPDPQGSAQGRLKRATHVTLRFMDTVGGQIGDSADDLEEMAFEWEDMDEPPPLYTGDVRHPVDFGTERNVTLVVQQSRPYPMTLLAIITEIRSSTQ